MNSDASDQNIHYIKLMYEVVHNSDFSPGAASSKSITVPTIVLPLPSHFSDFIRSGGERLLPVSDVRLISASTNLMN